jgi:hypothetical protein
MDMDVEGMIKAFIHALESNLGLSFIFGMLQCILSLNSISVAEFPLNWPVFQKSAPVCDFQSLLASFSDFVFVGEGDFWRHLQYVLQPFEAYSATSLDWYEWPIEKLGISTRDGVRLAKLAHTWTGDSIKVWRQLADSKPRARLEYVYKVFAINEVHFPYQRVLEGLQTTSTALIWKILAVIISTRLKDKLVLEIERIGFSLSEDTDVLTLWVRSVNLSRGQYVSSPQAAVNSSEALNNILTSYGVPINPNCTIVTTLIRIGFPNDLIPISEDVINPDHAQVFIGTLFELLESQKERTAALLTLTDRLHRLLMMRTARRLAHSRIIAGTKLTVIWRCTRYSKVLANAQKIASISCRFLARKCRHARIPNVTTDISNQPGYNQVRIDSNSE